MGGLRLYCESWEGQAAALGFDAQAPAADAMARDAGPDAGKEAGRDDAPGPAGGPGGASPGVAAEAESVARDGAPTSPAAQAVDWAVAHLSGREVAAPEQAGTLDPARLPGAEGLLTTARAVADER